MAGEESDYGKKFFAVLMTVMVSIFICAPAARAAENAGGDGIMRTGWQIIDGERYYFDEDGVMQIGWHEIDGVWYYFSESGALRK